METAAPGHTGGHDEQLTAADTLARHDGLAPTDPRVILKLPMEERARILREAAIAAAPFYRPGSEFVDDLVEDPKEQGM